MTISAPNGLASKKMAYFAIGVGDFFLSNSAMTNLSIIREEFPAGGQHVSNSTATSSVAATLEVKHVKRTVYKALDEFISEIRLGHPHEPQPLVYSPQDKAHRHNVPTSNATPWIVNFQLYAIPHPG